MLFIYALGLLGASLSAHDAGGIPEQVSAAPGDGGCVGAELAASNPIFEFPEEIQLAVAQKCYVKQSATPVVTMLGRTACTSLMS